MRDQPTTATHWKNSIVKDAVQPTCKAAKEVATTPQKITRIANQVRAPTCTSMMLLGTCISADSNLKSELGVKATAMDILWAHLQVRETHDASVVTISIACRVECAPGTGYSQ